MADMVIKEDSMVRPLVSPDEAVSAWREYEELKRKIVSPSDVQVIEGREFLKKAYWRKIERFFGLRLELLREERQWLEAIITKRVEKRRARNGQEYEKAVTTVEYYPAGTAPEPQRDQVKVRALAVSAYYRATAPNGQFCDGDGHCDSWEKGIANSIHNVIATAHTRAKNRAISDLVGGGEVSAEEIIGEGSVEDVAIDISSPKKPRWKKEIPPPAKPQEPVKKIDKEAGHRYVARMMACGLSEEEARGILRSAWKADLDIEALVQDYEQYHQGKQQPEDQEEEEP